MSVAPTPVITGGTAGVGRATVRAFADADLDAAQTAADRVESELGPIAVWVNCAFVGLLMKYRRR